MEELSENIDLFVSKFKKNKDFYFTGRGFVTFRNYKFAYLYKLINDKMLEKDTLLREQAKTSTQGRKRFQSAVKTLMVNKNLKNELK